MGVAAFVIIVTILMLVFIAATSFAAVAFSEGFGAVGILLLALAAGAVYGVERIVTVDAIMSGKAKCVLVEHSDGTKSWSVEKVEGK